MEEKIYDKLTVVLKTIDPVTLQQTTLEFREVRKSDNDKTFLYLIQDRKATAIAISEILMVIEEDSK